MKKTTQLANTAYHNRDYLTALSFYKLAIIRHPELFFTISKNIEACHTNLKENPKGIENKIESIHQLQKISPSSWMSKGNDPFFTINIKNITSKKHRFVTIKGIITTTKKNNTGHIYIDYGRGFSEHPPTPIRYKSGIFFEKTIELQDGAKIFRFDPFEEKLNLEIISFQAVGANEADVRYKLDILTQTLSRTTGAKFPEIKLSDISKIEFHTNKLPETRYSEIKCNEQITTQSKRKNEIDGLSIIALTTKTNILLLTHALQQFTGIKKIYIITEDNIHDILKTEQTNIHTTTTKEANSAWMEMNKIIQSDDASHFLYIKPNYIPNKNSLQHIEQAIKKHSTADLIYGDEDQLTNKLRHSPFFKPGWSFDLATCQDYITGMCIINSTSVKNLNSFKASEFGFEIYQLLLENHYKTPLTIEHMPHVITHKINSNCTKEHNDSLVKSITTALSNHPNFLRASKTKNLNIAKVDWKVPSPNPLVTLIIPTRDRMEITKVAVESILSRTTYTNYEIIIVDNQSSEISALNWFQEISKNPKVTVLKYDKPFNYSAINNFAVLESKGEFIGLINNDIEVINSGWLEELVSIAARADVGCVGAKLYFDNDTIQHGGVIVGLGGLAGHSHKFFDKSSTGVNHRLVCRQNYRAVTAACLIIKKSIYNEVNGLNEKDLTVAFNDVDFCLKVERAGYNNIWTPYAELYHYESISRGADDNPVKAARFKSESIYLKTQWNTDKTIDKYYHKNLTQIDETFSIIEPN